MVILTELISSEMQCLSFYQRFHEIYNTNNQNNYLVSKIQSEYIIDSLASRIILIYYN